MSVIEKMRAKEPWIEMPTEFYDDMLNIVIEDMKLWAMENRKDPTFVPSYAKSRGIE